MNFFFVWEWFTQRSKIASPLVDSSLPFVKLDMDVLPSYIVRRQEGRYDKTYPLLEINGEGYAEEKSISWCGSSFRSLQVVVAAYLVI